MREAMFSAMFEGVIPEVPGVLFQSEPKQPEVQEQRIWEIDSDEEEKEEKKRAKKKRQYLRKKEKAQAEKAERQLQQKSESEDAIAKDLADMSIQDAPTVSTDEHESNSDITNTANTTQPKLSKRQKKTLLKKTKQAQAATTTPELGHSSNTGDTTSDSSHVKSSIVGNDENEKENKARETGHEKQDNKPEGGEDEVATESEVEAVMETIAKRFGQ
jgi:hypothetical protein